MTVRSENGLEIIAATLRKGQFDSKNCVAIVTAGGDYRQFQTSRKTCAPPVQVDIATPDGVKNGPTMQDDMMLNAINWEIEGIEAA